MGQVVMHLFVDDKEGKSVGIAQFIIGRRCRETTM